MIFFIQNKITLITEMVNVYEYNLAVKTKIIG